MAYTRQNLRREVRRHKPDYSLVLVISSLLIVGMIVLYSIGPALEISTGITVGRQALSIFLGWLAFMITFMVPIEFWPKVKNYIFWAATISVLLLAFAPGGVINPETKGARRWLVLGPFSFQPAELIKFALLVYLATLLTHRIKHDKLNDVHETLLPVAVITALLGFVVVVLQKDLGSMLVIVAMIVSMLYMAGLRFKLFSGFMAGLAGVGVLAIALAPHRLERLTSFLNPGSDALDTGFHINQALIAVGSGGLFGLGLGKSIQAHGYLPEAANDSIFAIYAEKFGFIGALVIVSLFGYLLFKLVQIVERAPNTYLRLMAAGVLAWVGAHIFINIGAILGLLPLTGITLPFLSYGGSSILFIMAAIGLVMNISRYSVHERVVGMRRRGGAA